MDPKAQDAGRKEPEPLNVCVVEAVPHPEDEAVDDGFDLEPM